MRYPFGVADDVDQKLFIDWLAFLCDRDLGGAPRHGGVKGIYTIGLADGTDLTVCFEGDPGQVEIGQANGQHDLAPLVAEAFRRGKAGEFGDGHWFSISFECKPGMAELLPIQFSRSLSEHKRYEGDWALTNDCLLTFKHEGEPGEPVVFPKFSLETRFRAPSPWHGPYGQRQAAEFGALVRATCSFASGASFNPLSSPPWPLKADQVEEVRQPSPPEYLSSTSTTSCSASGSRRWPRVPTQRR